MTGVRLLPSDWVLAGVLTVLALWVPLPLYLVSIACFGLPHVLWELRWVLGQTKGALPRWWWAGLAAILAVQATARLAVALGRLDGQTALVVDLLCLGAALALVLTLPGLRDGGFRGRASGLVAMAGAVTLAYIGVDGRLETMAWALIALSVAHNFTPMALERLVSQPGGPWSGLRFMMALPLALLVLPALPPPALAGAAPPWPPVEFLWLNGVPDLALPNLLPALVLAQCLHYLAVLRVLPRGTGPTWGSGGWRLAAIGAAAALTVGFFWSFPDARKFYGVAAGLHAWLEWPIMLCLLGGVLGKGRSSP